MHGVIGRWLFAWDARRPFERKCTGLRGLYPYWTWMCELIVSIVWFGSACDAQPSTLTYMVVILVSIHETSTLTRNGVVVLLIDRLHGNPWILSSPGLLCMGENNNGVRSGELIISWCVHDKKGLWDMAQQFYRNVMLCVFVHLICVVIELRLSSRNESMVVDVQTYFQNQVWEIPSIRSEWICYEQLFKVVYTCSAFVWELFVWLHSFPSTQSK